MIDETLLSLGCDGRDGGRDGAFVRAEDSKNGGDMMGRINADSDTRG
jgi:hypothetical protein